ncbi:MAG: helix-turn-helix transcriptional regulator [Rhodospirillales bacterium]|nr:helix-turn-helix transcriptional regulator [Rhodospirillales bacterium]
MKEKFHDLVLGEFARRKREHPELTQAEIARRLGRRPEQVHRWLAAPGNWTLETASDLLLAISASTAAVSVEPIAVTDTANHPGGPDWAADLAVAGEASAPAPPVIAGWAGIAAQPYENPILIRQEIPTFATTLGASA